MLTDTSPGFTPFAFGGGLWDADTGLVRFGARDYDPETGRWTTQDPIGLSGGDTNLYAYVAGDPINATDPTGLMLQGNPAMDSALNGGFLSWLGFEQFARGAYNYNEGRLKLSNDATAKEGIEQMRKGVCQMVGGGVQAVQAGYTAIGVVGIAGMAMRGLPAGAGALRAPRTVEVSRWGRPGLQPGDWVMKGPANWSNYLKSGKWQPGVGNQYAPFGSGQTFLVPYSSLKFPREFFPTDIIKWLLGQRIYQP